MTGRSAVALVTGAGSGIGWATAEQLALRGYTTFGLVRRPGDVPTGVRVVVADVRDDDAIRWAVNSIGPVDYLVNSAGVPAGGAVETTPLDAFGEAMQTNFLGTIRCIQAVLPGMRTRRSGRIVNISSLAAAVTVSPQAPYAAAKAAVETAAEALAQEVSEYGVTVTNVVPGVVATPIHAKPMLGYVPSPPYTRLERRLSSFVRGMLTCKAAATADEVATAVVGALESDRPPFRILVGPDAKAVSALRASMSVDDWIAYWADDDPRWLERFTQATGLFADQGARPSGDVMSGPSAEIQRPAMNQ